MLLMPATSILRQESNVLIRREHRGFSYSIILGKVSSVSWKVTLVFYTYYHYQKLSIPCTLKGAYFQIVSYCEIKEEIYS